MKDLNKDESTVGSMFDSIAFRYDFLNHFLSFGIDRVWRKKAIKVIPLTFRNPEIIDVATGTGDLAIAAMKLNPAHITGIDISEKMLEIGKEKIRKKGLSGTIDLIRCHSENISFKDNCFDIAMAAFGVRNFSDPLKGLKEMNRVLKSGGIIMVLEFSKPLRFPAKQLYNFYFLKILPVIGRLFSGDRAAYRYLPDSVLQFPDNDSFKDLMKSIGFTSVTQKKLTFGVASIYTGLKL